jgi:UDP-N-acetylmuramyl pentapeptide synthase
VLGDMLELGNHAAAAHKDVGTLAKELGLSVIALGDHAKEIGDAEVVDEPKTAAARALARTQPGDWILLKASRGMRLERVLDAMRGAQ